VLTVRVSGGEFREQKMHEGCQTDSNAFMAKHGSIQRKCVPKWSGCQTHSFKLGKMSEIQTKYAVIYLVNVGPIQRQ
jgi:hypothetical protein